MQKSANNGAKPAISIVLPVYNGSRWIASSIGCVLNQRCTDFELIVIDDGSTDDSWSVICSIVDPRIRASRQVNIGLASTLNVGIRLARADLVARQDQDDWMHPERLARQADFMHKHPECAAVGTWAEIREDDVPSGRYHKHPLGNAALRMSLLFDNPFVHSSMMLRRDAVLAKGGYCEDRARQPPEDYELWSRLAPHHEVANIGQVLTAYREVASSMSRTGTSPFQRNVLQISTENLAKMLVPVFTEEECRSLSSLYHGVSGETEGSCLPRCKALEMTHAAAVAVAGDPSTWSEEFATVHARLSARVAAQSTRRHFPKFVLGVGRALRRALA